MVIRPDQLNTRDLARYSGRALGPKYQRGFILDSSKANIGGGIPDPHFANTVLLCHADGSNGSTTFTNVVQALGRGNTITAAGTAAVSTTAPLFGTGAMNAGTGGGSSAASADYALSNTLTVEIACRTSTPSATMVLLDTRINGDPNKGWVINTAGGAFVVYIAEGGLFTAIMTAGTVATNTYQRIAWSQNAGSHKLFVDGTQVATYAPTLTFTASVPVRIGYSYLGTVPWVGYLDEVRITKGVCRYTGAYTPDVAAFPDA